MINLETGTLNHTYVHTHMAMEIFVYRQSPTYAIITNLCAGRK